VHRPACGAHPEKGSVHVGVTVDQVLAEHIGQETPLPSIELAIEEVGLNCGSGYGCACFNTISWRNPTMPLPMENRYGFSRTTMGVHKRDRVG